ncbi:MAG: M48 family metalloprotease [Acidobacteria bacterium]|nr:M48 family metalloprotease [Acidobacteriota bacterium]
MLDTAGLVILHGCIAALLVEALLRIWRMQDPGERLALRWLALVAPIILPAAFHIFAPVRSTEWFGSARALFAGEHWNQLRLGPVGTASLATVTLLILGLLLYLRDALPFLDDRVRGVGERDSVTDHPDIVKVRSLLNDLQPALGAPEMTILLLDRPVPVLLCSGVARLTLVISTGTLSRLSDDQLRAALAHEMAHAARRDPLMGWLLMVVRTVAWFSPAAQVVSRQIVQELEYRADVTVARLGHSAALAGAIAALADTGDSETDLVPPHARGDFSRRLRVRAELVAVGNRCERVFTQPEPSRTGLGPLRFGLVAAGLCTLLFFVV